MLAVVVTAANVQDKTGARQLAGQLRGRFPRLVRFYADGGYQSQPLMTWLWDLGRWVLEIVRGVRGADGFQIVPKRWIVERTFGWLNRYRRLSKDYEELPETSEVMILIAMTHLMLQRGRK